MIDADLAGLLNSFLYSENGNDRLAARQQLSDMLLDSGHTQLADRLTQACYEVLLFSRFDVPRTEDHEKIRNAAADIYEFDTPAEREAFMDGISRADEAADNVLAFNSEEEFIGYMKERKKYET